MDGQGTDYGDSCKNWQEQLPGDDDAGRKGKDMSHAIYPRECWIMYDEFMSKFSRQGDGTLLYMGEAVL